MRFRAHKSASWPLAEPFSCGSRVRQSATCAFAHTKAHPSWRRSAAGTALGGDRIERATTWPDHGVARLSWTADDRGFVLSAVPACADGEPPSLDDMLHVARSLAAP